jgi:hypothetical protein
MDKDGEGEGVGMSEAKDLLKSTMEQSQPGSAPNTIPSMYLVRHNSPKGI